MTGDTETLILIGARVNEILLSVYLYTILMYTCREVSVVIKATN